MSLFQQIGDDEPRKIQGSQTLTLAFPPVISIIRDSGNGTLFIDYIIRKHEFIFGKFSYIFDDSKHQTKSDDKRFEILFEHDRILITLNKICITSKGDKIKLTWLNERENYDKLDNPLSDIKKLW